MAASLDFSFSLLHFIVSNLNKCVTWSCGDDGFDGVSRSHQCSFTDSVYECLVGRQRNVIMVVSDRLPSKALIFDEPTDTHTQSQTKSIVCWFSFSSHWRLPFWPIAKNVYEIRKTNGEGKTWNRFWLFMANSSMHTIAYVREWAGVSTHSENHFQPEIKKNQ